MALPDSGHRRGHRGDHRLGRGSVGSTPVTTSTIELGRVLTVVGRALLAPRLSIPVAGCVTRDRAADRARLAPGPQTAQYQSSPRRCRVRSALPHVAQTGEEILIAPSLAQRDQQIPDGAGRRGPAVAQHRWPVDQRLSEPATLGPSACDALAHRGRCRRDPGRARAGDEVDEDTDRVSEHLGQPSRGHRSAARFR